MGRSDSRASVPDGLPSRGQQGGQLGARKLLGVALWGGTTTVAAYVLAFGSISLFIINMIAIGIVLRVTAYVIMRRRRQQPPRWWWL